MSSSSSFYDKQKYAGAINQFDKYIGSCEIVTPKHKKFGSFKISTITCVSTIAPNIDIEKLFKIVDEKNDDDIVYVKYSNDIKGEKKTRRNPLKRIKGKNQLFSNQMSFGFKCPFDHIHQHKNPISVKVFRNGRIQMTGCKNMTEIRFMYNKLTTQIFKMDKNHIIFPFTEDNILVEMINGTFYINQSLDLNKVLETFEQKYTHEQVFVIQNKKSPLNFSIKLLGYFDKKKSKDKIPSVFIYNTGAINIIATKKDILYQTYEFMKQNITENWEKIIEKKIIYQPIDDIKHS